jgi:L-ascorbate metabolism protein UlaG (beta-lactamase superfamily)
MKESAATCIRSPSIAEANEFTRGSVFFVGMATVVLRYGGFTVLTDPNFMHRGDRVHYGYGMTPQRLTEPALDFGQLPPVDLVVLSHYHGDHFDPTVERRLDKDIPIYTTTHAATALRGKGFKAVHAIDTWSWEEVVKGDARLRITAMPGRHGPGPLAYLLPPVMGSMLDFISPHGPRALRVYITGDTLMHKHLRIIPRHFPGIDLALVHLGGTRLLGATLTMDARQGVRLIQLVNPRTAIPIHYNDYTAFKSSVEEFADAVERAGLVGRVVYLRHGQIHRFSVHPSRWRGCL